MKRVDVKAILAEPELRQELMVDCLIATQAREGVTTSKRQAEAAYRKVRKEKINAIG